MTTSILPDWQDPAPGTTWAEILPDYQFPRISMQVRGILRDIRGHEKLTLTFKQKWIRAIASIFEENNIQNIIYKNPLDYSMLNSKIKEAEKSLNEVINSATDIESKGYDMKEQNESKRYDMKEQNERIIICFKEFIIMEQQGIHRNET